MARGEGRGAGGCTFVANVVSILQSIAAIAIVVLVAGYMYDTLGFRCLLDGKEGRTSSSICNYAWALAAFSMLASFVVFLLGCLTCCCGKVPMVINLVFQSIGLVWWLVGAIVITIYAVPAQDKNFPEEEKRIAIICLCWAEFVLFTIGAVASGKSMGE
mmetsp:Transcript_14329/g.30873  ORF Transcript_14329/g.30873 Transcript_14329/m.30873 type:complete len:159 (+) Transcript_14329:178-654(+)